MGVNFELECECKHECNCGLEADLIANGLDKSWRFCGVRPYFKTLTALTGIEPRYYGELTPSDLHMMRKCVVYYIDTGEFYPLGKMHYSEEQQCDLNKDKCNIILNREMYITDNDYACIDDADSLDRNRCILNRAKQLLKWLDIGIIYSCSIAQG